MESSLDSLAKIKSKEGMGVVMPSLQVIIFKSLTDSGDATTDKFEDMSPKNWTCGLRE